MLGRGASSIVYRVVDERTGAEQALKLLEPSATAGAEALERALRREFRLLAGLRHPHLVQVHDFGTTHLPEEDSTRVWLTMDFVPGRPIDEALGPPSDWTVFARLADALFSALEALHDAGLVHGDVTAANVLVSGYPAADPPGLRLMDLGLADRFHRAAPGVIRGTPATIAPERLSAGEVDARADLYSAGAVLYRLATGQDPFTSDDPWDVLRAHVRTAPTPPSHLNPEIPASLEDLLLSLLEKDPAARPPSARAARRLLAPLSGRSVDGALPPLRRALRPSFAGRTDERAAIEEAARDARRGRGSVVVVLGERGSGRSRLLEEARLAILLDDGEAVLLSTASAPSRPFGLLDAAADALGMSLDGPAVSRAVRLADALSRRQAALLIDDSDRADAASREALGMLAARIAEGTGGLLVLGAAEGHDDGGGGPIEALLRAGQARVVRLRPLGREEAGSLAASMLGRRELPPAWIDALHARSRGRPRELVRLIETLVRHGCAFDPAGVTEALERVASRIAADGGAPDLGPAWEALDEPARRLAGGLALVPGEPVPIDLLEEFAGPDAPAALAALVERGWVRRCHAAGGLLAAVLEDGGLARAVVARLDLDRRRELHRAHARRLERIGGAGAARAEHLAAADEPLHAAALLIDAAEAALDGGLASEAIRLAERARELLGPDADGSLTVTLEAALGRALARAGRGGEAQAAFERALAAARRLDDPGRLARTLRTAGESLGMLGRIDEGLSRLEEALALFDELAETAAGADTLIASARLLARSGRPADARQRLEIARRQAHRAEAPALEVEALLGLGRLAAGRGDAEHALELLANAEELAARAGVVAAGHQARQARIEAHLLSGRAGMALDDARAWIDAAEAADDIEAVRRAAHLSGRALTALGRRREAEAAFEQAADLARRLGDLAAAATALSEAARVRLERGQPAAAREQAAEALRLASGAPFDLPLDHVRRNAARIEAILGHPQEVGRLLGDAGDDEPDDARAWRGFLLGLAHLTAGAPEQARELLQEACFVARRASLAELEQEGRLMLAEAYLELREAERASLALKRFRGDAGPGPGGEERQAVARLLSAEAELARPDGDPRRAADEAELAATALSERERADIAWRAWGALAASARRLGDTALAGRAGREAFSRLDAWLAALPETDRARARGTLRARAVFEHRSEGMPDTPAAPASRGAALDEPALTRRVRDLERLLEINRSLNSARAPREVLGVLLDTAVELTGAERGFVLLGKSCRPEVELARGSGGTELAGEAREASRDVARRVMQAGSALRTLDAAGDARLRDSRSVHALRIRSVLAVPIRTRGETAGALVLDSRREAVGFDERAEALLVQLADQAGIALANASLIDELERRAEEIRRLNERLAEQVEEQRVELLEKQSNLELRYRFDSIVGASAPMQRLYRALDKLIPTEIPVLVTGASGTGKDLVARVLHYNGPRREQRFVTVNCAALTDTLLESELFGHRRGAFTGAERDRRGLFEQADAGTLFLDEIGEMPLHLQPKLLRAIQFGEVRRVGEDVPRHVDVRIIAATNRDMKTLVAEGRFREDLYYRLDVGRVHLAPLGERLEDLGLLVDHFLERAAERAGGPPLRIEPAALRLFTRHDWPGNVRELENEITRLVAFCDGPVITELDVLENTAFAERVREEAAGGEPPADSGTLERLEIERIREALREAGGNRTRAARILGIDRSTLYRKLKRLGQV